MKNSLLEKIKQIKVERQDKIIIRQIRQLIKEGVLKSGDKLPPERQLAEQFDVGRGYVRRAIQQLEFYGIVKTHPQSGTVVAEMGVTVLDDFLGNVLSLEEPDGQSLLESRAIIEIETARLAALRVESSTLIRLEEAFEAYKQEVMKDSDAMEQDTIFHIRIAECAQNSVLRSMIMVVAQDIIRQSRELDGCSGDRKYRALEEHERILNAIRRRDPDVAAKSMADHLKNTKV